jgi:hypothetical protein
MDNEETQRPKLSSTAKSSDFQKQKIDFDDDVNEGNTSGNVTSGGDEYTPAASTVSVVESQSVSAVWSSILNNLKILQHPFACTPATEYELLAAETRMGYPMPSQMKELYRLTNGIKSPRRWDVYMPYDVQFRTIETFSPNNSYDMMQRFESSMEMWNHFTSYTCMDNFSGGLLYEWDSSFDGQCGNVILANSLSEYLKKWNDGLGKRIQDIVAIRDNLLSTLSKSKSFPRLSNDIAFKIALYAAPFKDIRMRN